MVARVREVKEVAVDALILVATDVGVFAGLRSRERSPFDRSLRAFVEARKSESDLLLGRYS